MEPEESKINSQLAAQITGQMTVPVTKTETGETEEDPLWEDKANVQFKRHSISNICEIFQWKQ